MRRSTPPRTLEALIARCLPADARETVLGDLREEYEAWAEALPAGVPAARYLGAGLLVAVHYAADGLVSHRGAWGDLRVAARRLGRSPAFTLLALVAITLGIGANAVTLGVARGVFLTPLPFPESDRLGLVTYDFAGSESDGFGLGYRDVEEMSAGAPSLERVSPVLDWVFVDLTGEGEPRRLSASFLGPGTFELLGAETVLGRTFTADENRRGAGASVALLSRSFWRESLGGDPGVVGRTVTLNGSPVEIVGVLPGEEYDLRQRFGRSADVYLPLFTAEPLLGQALLEQRGAGPLNALVRLRRDATVEGARAELDALSRRLAAEHPESNEGWSFHLEPLEEVFFADVRTPVLLLLTGAVLVFLLVAFGLVGLLLVRALGRRHEASVRRALGAVPGQILRLSLAEASLLAVAGTTLGLALAGTGIALLDASALLALPTFTPLRLTPGVVGVSALSAGLLALTLGLASWAPSALGEPGALLREGGRSTPGTGTRRIRQSLVVGEIGLAFALLIVSGLLVRSFQALQSVDMGFDTERLLTLKLELRGERYGEDDARRAVARELMERAAAVPGVDEAFLWSPNGVGEGSWVDLLTREGRWDLVPAERMEASRHHVHPGALPRAGIRILRGRDLRPSDDAGSPPVALVSESLAARLWPGEDPLGKSVESRPGGELRVRRVVGIVEDARHRSRFSDPSGPQLDVYYAYEQWPPWGLSVAARLAPGADVGSVAASLRNRVAELDPRLPLYDLATMEERMREEEARARLTTWMVSGYALVATLLAALGIYGVLAQTVRDRSREIGVRMALGAERRRVMGSVAGRGLAALVPGSLLGLLLVWSASGLIEGALYRVPVWDVRVLAAAAALLLLVGGTASVVPAVRASRVSPVEALTE